MKLCFHLFPACFHLVFTSFLFSTCPLHCSTAENLCKNSFALVFHHSIKCFLHSNHFLNFWKCPKQSFLKISRKFKINFCALKETPRYLEQTRGTHLAPKWVQGAGTPRPCHGVTWDPQGPPTCKPASPLFLSPKKSSCHRKFSCSCCSSSDFFDLPI